MTATNSDGHSNQLLQVPEAGDTAPAAISSNETTEEDIAAAKPTHVDEKAHQSNPAITRPGKLVFVGRLVSSDKRSKVSSVVSDPSSAVLTLRLSTTQNLTVSKSGKLVLCPQRTTTPTQSSRPCKRHSLLASSNHNVTLSSGVATGVVTVTQTKGDVSRASGAAMQTLFQRGADWDNLEYYLPPSKPRGNTPRICLTTPEGDVVENEERIRTIGDVKLEEGGHDQDRVKKNGNSVQWGGVMVYRLRV